MGACRRVTTSSRHGSPSAGVRPGGFSRDSRTNWPRSGALNPNPARPAGRGSRTRGNFPHPGLQRGYAAAVRRRRQHPRGHARGNLRGVRRRHERHRLRAGRGADADPGHLGPGRDRPAGRQRERRDGARIRTDDDVAHGLRQLQVGQRRARGLQLLAGRARLQGGDARPRQAYGPAQLGPSHAGHRLSGPHRVARVDQDLGDGARQLREHRAAVSRAYEQALRRQTAFDAAEHAPGAGGQQQQRQPPPGSPIRAAPSPAAARPAARSSPGCVPLLRETAKCRKTAWCSGPFRRLRRAPADARGDVQAVVRSGTRLMPT